MAAGLWLLACTCSRNDAPTASASASAASPPSSAPAEPDNTPERLKVDRIIRMPSGPVLEIIPGEGLGAIRLGASVETIERLMAMPCEFKTEHACRYLGRAVEFFLDDKGLTNEIRIHRVERPTTPEGRTFGVFNGRMRVGVTLMMLPRGVQGLIGQPKKVETVTADNPFHTVEVDYYDGMRIEYDRLTPEKVVVGGIILTKSESASAGPPGSGAHPRPATTKPAH
jgi:hypothetical protein